MKNIIILIGMVGICLRPHPGYSLDLTAPYLMENTNVLPAGVRNPRFVNVFMSVDSKFDGTGRVLPLGNPLRKAVKWNDIINSLDDPKRRITAKAKLAEAGVDFNGSAGMTSGEVNSFVDVKVPVLAVGVTRRLTLGVAVPIVSVNVNADTGFIQSDTGEAQRFVNAICRSSVSECNQAARKLNNSVNEKLTSYGYQTVQSESFTRLGDIQLVGKYQTYQDEVNSWTLRSSLVIPTGTPLNVDRALDIPTGDGRYQVGGTLIYGRNLSYDLRWTAHGGALAFLPHQLEKRIPMSQEDLISRDKERLTRDWGASFSVGSAVNYSIPSVGLNAAAGYQVQYQTPTRYTGGTRFDQDRYSFLEGFAPSQTLHSATLTAGFSTVEWYQAKKFVYPFQANFVYSHSLSGRNVTATDVMSGELVLFF